MKVLVTGSSGLLGKALVKKLNSYNYEVVGLDLKPSPYTSVIGSINDRALLMNCLSGVKIVFHTAALHKPHLKNFSRNEFFSTNVIGTHTLLDVSLKLGVEAFIYTSTTNIFGQAMEADKHGPSIWVNEDLAPIPRDKYSYTKWSAENLCRFYSETYGLATIALRTSRFFVNVDLIESFPEYSDLNQKANEFLFKRVELLDAVDAHFRALDYVKNSGFGVFVISAPTMLKPSDCVMLNKDANEVVATYYTDFEGIYKEKEFKMYPSIPKVYDSTKAQEVLKWKPEYDFKKILSALTRNLPIFSPFTLALYENEDPLGTIN